MTVPVINNLLQQNPQLQITVVSSAFFQPLFDGLERCHFYPAFLKDQHKGIAGIFRLFKELNRLSRFDAIADLHSVLRSHLLSVFFKINGFKIARLDKGRNEKKALTRKTDKVFEQLTPMHERYAEVFRKAGLSVKLEHDKPVYENKLIPQALHAVFASGKRVIGVAPFAQYKEKMYPVEKMKEVVKQLALKNTVLLFGGGKNESNILQQWEADIFSAFNIAGKYSFADELAVISNLNAMVSMDSANMHLASLFKIPVVSIWGATHPFAGFYGWAQDEINIVQINDLSCRPCSVFGNKPCFRGDHACMNRIEENSIVEKLSFLELQRTL